MIKKYKKDDITVVWKPRLCEHSKICVRGLPNVFNPKNQPWVNLDGADADTIINQVSQCPSGALSIEDSNKPVAANESSTSVKITIKKGGAMRISGPVEIIDANGNTITRDRVSLCRCGHTKLQPYCDGSHKTLENFE